MDTTQPPGKDTFFCGPINKMKKECLINVCQSLGIESEGNIPALCIRLQRHIDAHPDLADNPKYQQMFVYRPNNKVSEKYAKKSLHKVAEDIAEEEKRDKVKEITRYVFSFFFLLFFFSEYSFMVAPTRLFYHSRSQRTRRVSILAFPPNHLLQLSHLVSLTIPLIQPRSWQTL